MKIAVKAGAPPQGWPRKSASGPVAQNLRHSVRQLAAFYGSCLGSSALRGEAMRIRRTYKFFLFCDK
jgi:hypothetical protein